MYTGLVCFVLFDARGEKTGGVEQEPWYWMAGAALMLLMLVLKHMPTILHRPKQIDMLCEDLLHISIHASCVAAMPPGHGHLRYACALHCALFLLQNRFLPTPMTHLAAVAWLSCAYAYGPRVTDIQTFIAAVASPHTMDIIAGAAVQAHRLATLCLMEW